jgi:glycosyltransferase involved in cell wall biosynthesis
MRRPSSEDRPLRIAYVNGSLALGGSERQMVLLARHLPRSRFQVEFVLLGQPGELAEEARAAGAVVHALRGPSRSNVPLPLWVVRVMGSAWAFVRLVRRRRYDVVDAWLFGSYALAAATRPVLGITVLVSGRRSLSDFKATFNFVQRAADRLAARRSDAIVANAYAVADDVQRRERLPADRILVIRNAVEIIEAPGADEIRNVRAGWGAPADSVIIGCVANYKRGKGLELLLDAFARVARSSPKAHLVLVGEGPIRPVLERRRSELDLVGRVTLAGATPDPRRLYFAFDVAVLASETEGLPNVLLEAAAAARPLVATDAGASREIVIDGTTGILAPIGDGEAISAALERLVDAPDLRTELGRNALAHVRAEFSVERSVSSFAALYEDLVTRRVAPGT